jgi:putative ABC transport system ATP-binding protein
LQTKKLVKEYQMGEVTIHALRSVDFVLEKGEFIAIMGPSESGKSTLFHLLGGLDTSSNGEVTLSGKRLAQLNDDDLPSSAAERSGSSSSSSTCSPL